MKLTPRIVFLSLLAACARPEARPQSEKPMAPVAVSLTARTLAGGEIEATLVATPTANVPDVELRLVLPQGATVTGATDTHTGALAAGTRRTLTARLRLPAAASQTGVDLVGDARVRLASGNVRSRAAVAHVGPAAAAVSTRPTRIVTLPNGVRVAEVRP